MGPYMAITAGADRGRPLRGWCFGLCSSAVALALLSGCATQTASSKGHSSVRSPSVIGRPAVSARRPNANPAEALPVCPPSSLSASVEFHAANNGLIGAMLLTNVGRGACTLDGRGRVVLTADHGTELPMQDLRGGLAPSSSAPSEPTILASGSRPGAGIILGWFNWCSSPVKVTGAWLEFPGWPSGSKVVAAVAGSIAQPPCNNQASPSLLSVDYVRPWTGPARS